MGMVVRTNTMAMNANRQLSMNNSQVAKSLEKLSSGFRINRAADDASGLAISEKMKAQIKGLEQASANSQDGISLIQTAEGGLTEVHNMLNRMVELATKSANGTIRNEVDREAIQTEVDALNTEITRISKATNFNGINLLDGSLSAKGGSAAVSNIKIDNLTTTTVDATKFTTGALAGTSVLANSAKLGDQVTMTVAYTQGGQEKSTTLTMTLAKNDAGAMVMVGDSGKEYAIAGLAADGVKTDDLDKAFANEIQKSELAGKFKITGGYKAGFTFEALEAGSGGARITAMSTAAVVSGVTTNTAVAVTVAAGKNGDDAYYTAKPTLYDGTNADSSVFTVNGKKYAVAKDKQDVSGLDKDVKVIFGADLATAATNAAGVISKETGLTVVDAKAVADGTLAFKAGKGVSGNGGLTLQIGDTNDDFNKVTVSVGDMSAKGIGTEGLNVSDQDSAGDAIDTIKAAINTVSTNRANLGALQNRLEYTINNLDTTAENMNAANSRIRDTDMAKEMMNYTKMNILTQAAQAMLAQANQQPQAILQLLQ